MNDCSACCVSEPDVVDEASDPEVLEVPDEPAEDVLPSRETPTLARAWVIALINPSPGGGGGGPLPVTPWLASEPDERFAALDELSCEISEVRSEMLPIDM